MKASVSAVALLAFILVSRANAETKGRKCVTACPFIYWPVCGTDGKTYANRCLLKSEACLQDKVIKMKHDGPCSKNLKRQKLGGDEEKDDKEAIAESEPRKCNRACPFLYWPVCGTDGKTYDNLCLLKLEACVKNKVIEVQHEREC